MPFSRSSTSFQMTAAVSDLLNNPAMRTESSAKPTLPHQETTSAGWRLLLALVGGFPDR